MKEIALTQGMVAFVDDEDFEVLSNFKWFAMKGYNTFYAARAIAAGPGKQATLRMHVAIIGDIPPGCEPDHKDGNGLNNQRNNLRLVTRRQNTQNRNIKKISQYPGVTFDKARGKWKAQIMIDGINHQLGRHPSEEGAAMAYRNAMDALGQKIIKEVPCLK